MLFRSLAAAAAFFLPLQPAPPATPLAQAKRALAAREFPQAKALFGALHVQQPDNPEVLLGLADAELGLGQYLAAERDYRRVTAAEPQQWYAHRNLVITEAALGRWEDFDGERAVLAAARARHATGLGPNDSDVIDILDPHTRSGAPQHWVVRDYATPLGRSGTLYNFERFSRTGKVEAYVSLESGAALEQELTPAGGVAVGGTAAAASPAHGFALDFYTGRTHGTIARYATEPTYERLRADFLRWVRTHA